MVIPKIDFDWSIVVSYFKTVIPQALLDHYISMTEPSKAQAIDTELAKHCAFSFPAVSLTLGARNWPCLRDTYDLLSSDMQVCVAYFVKIISCSDISLYNLIEKKFNCCLFQVTGN